eukprot:1178285-Prorocentrum_minimum.AAC.3
MACLRTQLYSAARRGDAQTAETLLREAQAQSTEGDGRNAGSSFTPSPNVASLALFEGMHQIALLKGIRIIEYAACAGFVVKGMHPWQVENAPHPSAVFLR